MFNPFRTDSSRPSPDMIVAPFPTMDSLQLGEYAGFRFVHDSGLGHIPKEHTASTTVDSSRPHGPSASASSMETRIGKTNLSSPSISRPITNLRPSSLAVAPVAADSNPLTTPLSTNQPENGPSQDSSTKKAIRTTWHGIAQLLQKVERSLAGTPFQAPVAAVNSIIEVIDVRSIISLYLAILDDQFLTGRRWQTTRALSINVLFKLPTVLNA